MLAYLEYEDSLCPYCGLPREECQAKEAEGTFEAVPIRCHASRAQAMAERQWARDKGDMQGLLWALKRR